MLTANLKMTKIFEWLVVLGSAAALWLSLVTNKIETSVTKTYPNLILWSPLIFLVLFGVYVITVVLYRVFTFNNCEKAAAELQEEIEEARADLARLGFQFKEK